MRAVERRGGRQGTGTRTPWWRACAEAPNGDWELQVGNGQTLYSPSERSDLFAFGLDREFGDGLNARLKAYGREISDQQPRFIGLQQVKFPRL
jgi:hypothetical protein